MLAPKRLEQTRTKSVLELKLKIETPHELMVSAGGGAYALKTDASANLKIEEIGVHDEKEEPPAPAFKRFSSERSKPMYPKTATQPKPSENNSMQPQQTRLGAAKKRSLL